MTSFIYATYTKYNNEYCLYYPLKSLDIWSTICYNEYNPRGRYLENHNTVRNHNTETFEGAIRMTFIQGYKTDFETIKTNVTEMCKTEHSYEVNSNNLDLSMTSAFSRRKLLDCENYTDFGFKSMGRVVKFPAPFVRELNSSDSKLSQDIVENRLKSYFASEQNKPFTVREFNNKVCGVVSDKYAYFDDNEVVDILENSPLSKMKFENVHISPERFHLRAIDKDNPFKLDGDDSNMFFTFFVDNSMVGASSFRVRFGVFRQVCSNGLIIPHKEFVVVKQVHRGTKDIAAIFNSQVAMISEKRNEIIAMLNDSTEIESKIEKLSEEYKADYLAKKLNTSKAETEKILMLYNTTYGGKTKWALTNAITEFARDTNNIDRREMLETRALNVA